MKKILFLLILLFCFFIIACKEEQEDNELNSRSIDNGISSENEQDIENNNQDKENEHNEKSQEDNSDVELHTSNDNKNGHVESNMETIIDDVQLSDELEFLLKKSYVDIINSEFQSGSISIDDVEIIRYFGEYGVNGNIFALMIKGALMHPMSIPENKYYIFTMKEDDIFRVYYVKRRIVELPLFMDLNENKIYDLLEVCNKGILSINEMDRIMNNYEMFVGEIMNDD